MIDKQRNKNKAILELIITFVFFTFLIIIIAFPVYSNISDIEKQKDEFNKVYDINYSLKSKGLDYKNKMKKIDNQKDFVSILRSDTNMDKYTKLLLTPNLKENTGITKDFYKDFNKDFKGNNYIDYLDRKKKAISLNDKSILNNNKKIISKILPKYSDNINLSDYNIEGTLSTTDFVNNIERLLNKYNLDTKSKIGISKIVKVDVNTKKTNNRRNNKQKDKINDFDFDLYYIPIKLDIKGKKIDILDFFEEVLEYGNLYKKGENLVYLDKKEYKPINEYKKLSSGKKELVKEISSYEQFLIINKVEMSEYIDDNLSENQHNLIEAIRNRDPRYRQLNDDFSFNLELQYYISGISKQELSKGIKKILGKLDDVKIIDNFDKYLEKDLANLNDKIKSYVNYYNSLSLSNDNVNIGKYNQIKLRIKKYKQELKSKDIEDKLGEEEVKEKLKVLNDYENKIYNEYFDKDIKSILNDDSKGENIEKNYEIVNQYIYIFNLIEKELDLIHSSLF